MVKSRSAHRQRGFSLIEALIALAVTAFGLLALAGVALKLAYNEDIARQRGEATRLAQEQIESLRSFTQLAAAPGANAWDSMASNVSGEQITNTADFNTNTTFTRSWQVFDSTSDPWRRVSVTVAWTDRVKDTAEPQSITFNSIISKTDPFDSGALNFPLPGNGTMKRPKNRSMNIPVPAVDLGEGKSAIPVSTGLYAVFSNESGWVVRTCNFNITNASQLNLCPETTAYIVAGYISLKSSGNGNNINSLSFPADLAINTSQVSGSTGVVCNVSDARDQNTNSVISGYKYYLCVVYVAAEGQAWSGTLRLAATALNNGTADVLVCRFQYAASNTSSANQRNVQPYSAVADSLDNQNYVLTDTNSCPTIDSLATTQHQNCRSNNASRASECPATSVAP
jgi:prepilin-type N-terminal cleavage/methylation domain-containing protein